MNSLDVAKSLNLIHEGAPKDIKDVFFDSRVPIKDALFVAIKGQNTDGHLYIKNLLDKNIAGFVTAEDFKCPILKDKFCLKAKNPVKTLQDIARLKRDRLRAKVIGISGSAGKTTTKELISHVLPGKVHKTYKNFNSQIGLPKIIISADEDIDYMVLEMGATAVEDVKKLTDIANQHIGVVISIGEEHLESFGSIENVARGNFEVFDSKNFIAGVYPKAFESFYKKHNGLSFCKFREDADIKIKNITVNEEGTSFYIDNIKITIPVLNIGIAESTGATIGVLKALGIDWRDLKETFEGFEGISGRMQLIKKQKIRIIDDTYNANPVSIKNAILTLDSFKDFKKIIVLGDMLEMGQYEKALHERVGTMIKNSYIDSVYFYGGAMRYAYEIAKASNKEVLYFENQEELSAYLTKSLKQTSDKGYKAMVLVKGSRGMKMENVIRGLQNAL